MTEVWLNKYNYDVNDLLTSRYESKPLHEYCLGILSFDKFVRIAPVLSTPHG